MPKTTRETQYGILWGTDPDPVVQFGLHNLLAVQEAAEITQAKLEAGTGFPLTYKIVRREIEYSEGDWKNV